jgi:hypothetical protein
MPERTPITEQIVQLASDALPQPLDLGEEEVYMLFAAFCGDVERTAHACNRTPAMVLEMSQRGGWYEKLKNIIELKRSGRPGDVERAINRAINFVQAHRLRMVLEAVVRHISSMPFDDLMELIITPGRDPAGNTVNRLLTRPFADLAAAIEKCHAMTYLATGDTSTERKDNTGMSEDGVSAGEIHARIAAAFSKPSDQLKP